ncbi:hypothetical protein DNTS_005490 [Danionella cerebrum]|uniref:Immunoglobulin subtype domain-containing protein n=1 Tax=Danionella cerebrum TaxID=2873325 RepID=A0A553PYG1_9TELE|nr:hypothetical protein DNTS_005490 [Danionella translucida]
MGRQTVPRKRAPGTVTSKRASIQSQTNTHLMWLVIIVLHCASFTKGLTPIVLPQTMTTETGKTITFQCGFTDLNTDKIHFYIMGSKVNDSVNCPGDEAKYLPKQSMKAYCSPKGNGQIASWELGGTSEDDNNTMFLCRVNHYNDTVGYLYVYANDSYYAKLIGYVIGGFLAALITVIVAYILLKRSEKAQRCFRSVGGIQDDGPR